MKGWGFERERGGKVKESFTLEGMTTALVDIHSHFIFSSCVFFADLDMDCKISIYDTGPE